MHLLLALGSLLVLAASQATERTVVGTWRLEPALSTPAPPPAGESERPRGRPPGGHKGGGGMGIPGMRGMPGGADPNQKDMRRLRVVMDRLTQPPTSLTIVRAAATVTITDGDGRVATYTTDSRKEERVTGDGEFVSRSHFEGNTLVIEEEFGGGVKLTTRAAPVLSGDHEQLEVTLKATGLPKEPGPSGGGRRSPDKGSPRPAPLDTATRVYEKVEP